MDRARNEKRQVRESIHYSFVPNHRETMQALARARFSNNEFRVVIALLNQTDGYLRDDDELSSSFWQALTFMSRQSVHATLNRLVSLGVIARNDSRCKVNHPNSWSSEVFKPQQLARRSISMASSLVSKEKGRHDYRWLTRLLAASPGKDAPCPAREDPGLKASPARDAIGPTQQDSDRRPSPARDAAGPAQETAGPRPSPDRDAAGLDTESGEPKASSARDAVSEGHRLQPETAVSNQRRSPSLSGDDLKLPKESVTKESFTKESIPVAPSRSLQGTPCNRVKPFQREAGLFLDWVASKENIKFPNRDKLMRLVRATLAATKAGLEELKEWYDWVKAHDPYWGAREPPVIISRAPEKFPTWQRDRKEGKLHGQRQGLREPGTDPWPGVTVIRSRPDVPEGDTS